MTATRTIQNVKGLPILMIWKIQFKKKLCPGETWNVSTENKLSSFTGKNKTDPGKSKYLLLQRLLCLLGQMLDWHPLPSLIASVAFYLVLGFLFV